VTLSDPSSDEVLDVLDGKANATPDANRRELLVPDELVIDDRLTATIAAA
jgi:hypothetical protein